MFQFAKVVKHIFHISLINDETDAIAIEFWPCPILMSKSRLKLKFNSRKKGKQDVIFAYFQP